VNNPDWWKKLTPVNRFGWACAVNNLEDYAIGMLYDDCSGIRPTDKTYNLRIPTLLFDALVHRRERVAKCLLELGAEVNIECLVHYTPLGYAVLNKMLSVAEMLIRRGADVRHVPAPIHGFIWQASAGRTALHDAVNEGQMDLVRLLVENGADLDSHEHGICPPIHLAARHNYRDIMRYLAEQGADFAIRYYGECTLVEHLREASNPRLRQYDLNLEVQMLELAVELSR
jgi:ankyrin repeat protein